MGETLRARLPLEKKGPAGAFVLSDEQVAAIGDGAKVFPVTVVIGEKLLALRLARMGGENLIGLSKVVRAEADVEIGQSYDVEISADLAVRAVEVPDDLAAALAADPEAAAAFEKLAASHRKEYVRWVSDAKREQTRAERIARTVERVRAGERP